MKRFICLILLGLAFTACYTDNDRSELQAECKALIQQKENLQSTVSRLNDNVNYLNSQVHDLQIQKSAYQSGREIKYIVKFQIKQGTFTLDIFEHIKNEINCIEVEIPVSKSFYDSVSIGTDITDSFKWGSLVMDGDFSTLHMRVINKRME